jgi:hypothetical protein
MWDRWVRFLEEWVFWRFVAIFAIHVIACVIVLAYVISQIFDILFGYSYINKAEYVRFQTAEELAEASPVIVKVTATKDSVPYNLPFSHYTKTKVTIDEVLRDESESLQLGETVVVIEQYWISGKAMFPDKTVYNGNYYSKLVPGASYLLFLTEKPDHDGYWTVGFHQGKYNLDRKDKLERRMEKKDPLYGELRQSVLASYAAWREAASSAEHD